ncbi:hypothetical protein OF83DRAFT_1251718 [Amylostereum chailletii]|nr:hypothetical protein OF83DRAFT_1251718 [Amylostereum chailletii]
MDPPHPPSDTLEAAHSLWYIRLLLVVTAFLHTEYHLPFRGCAILLFALRTIFVALSLIPQDDPMLITLTTTFKSLDMEDRFQILVACPKCLHLHASDTTTDRRCAKFCAHTSPYAPSHSSGVFSFCVSNLPEAIRYDPKNLLVGMMTPGPTEPTAKQLQEFLVLLVNELIRLYEHGIWPRRDGKSHNLHAEEWLQLTNKKERKAYFDKHGTRWTEFSRLRYFDVVRMTVIDPMHNLLLVGLVKNQWYSNWILQGSLRTTTEAGTKRELAVIHEFLDSLEVPSWLGRLPLRVGDPAGGSLGVDEYKMLITTPAVMLLPFIWDIFLPSATQEYEVAKAKFDSNSRKGKEKAVAVTGDVAGVKNKSKKGKGNKATMTTVPKSPTWRIHPDETRLTLLLAAAIKVLLAFSHTEESLQRGEALLTEYLLLYKQVHGQDKMKPNHHFSTHTGDHIRDYGPVPGFWAFLSERLNKILKSFNLNNWSGGQMEITMMRSIARDVRLKDLVRFSPSSRFRYLTTHRLSPCRSPTTTHLPQSQPDFLASHPTRKYAVLSKIWRTTLVLSKIVC